MLQISIFDLMILVADTGKYTEYRLGDHCSKNIVSAYAVSKFNPIVKYNEKTKSIDGWLFYITYPSYYQIPSTFELFILYPIPYSTNPSSLLSLNYTIIPTEYNKK